MAHLQKQLEEFHRNIMFDFEQKSDLRDKRDKLLQKITRSLSEQKKPIPILENQGSYIYGVGIKPVSGDYDIDVGLVFNIKSDAYRATDLRNWIYNAVKKHTENVEQKGPCIRVRYEAGYHVDLVCYASNSSKESENFKLAHKNGSWIPSNPKKIKEYVQTARKKFNDTQDNSGSDQLQRVVRFLKRWIDLMFPKESDDKPTGLAILLYCIETLQSPAFDSQRRSDDLQALIYIAEKARNSDQIIACKPGTGENVFQKISDSGMQELISKFQQLHHTLLGARNSDNLKNVCELMRSQFGNDFPLGNNVNTQIPYTPKKKYVAIPTERPWRCE